MSMPIIRNVSLVSAALFSAAALLPGRQACAQATAALTGRVSSVAQAAMEGVLVSARRDGTNITVTVVSDASGRYSFPAARLAAGHYTLAIRAVGYELDRPKTADVSSGAT